MPRVRVIWSTLALLGAATALMVPQTAAAASLPAAPSGLTINHNRLDWVDNSIDETGFAIDRCLGTGCTAFGQIATVPAGTTTFTDSFWASGTDRYRVRAFNGAGSSAPSNVVETIVVTVNEVFPVITASPTNGTASLTVNFDGSRSTTISGAPTSYTWSFGDDQTATGAVASHTYTTPGVYAASLRVTGGNFGGSADSTAVLITVTAPPLAVANNLTGTSPVRGQIRLTWTNPASSATSLVIERCKGSMCTRFVPLATLSTSETSYTDAKVGRGSTYSYRLAASNAVATVYSNRAVVTARK